MEEDIKELTRLYDIAEVVLPKYSTEKIKYVISEKQRISIKNILNRLQEDEAVIKEMTKDKYENIDMYEMAEMANEIEYKLVDLFNGIPEEKAYEVIEQYFRKKVQDERNKNKSS